MLMNYYRCFILFNYIIAEVCEDSDAACAVDVEDVPSDCYTEASRRRCCASCALYMRTRDLNGYDVDMCPYGDRASFCISNSFNSKLL